MPDEMTKAIAADLGIASLPENEQKELIAQFGQVALQAATMAIMEKMTPPTREEFMKLGQGGDPAAMQAFLDKEVPDHETIAKAAVAAEVKRFKEATS